MTPEECQQKAIAIIREMPNPYPEFLKKSAVRQCFEGEELIDLLNELFEAWRETAIYRLKEDWE